MPAGDATSQRWTLSVAEVGTYVVCWCSGLEGCADGRFTSTVGFFHVHGPVLGGPGGTALAAVSCTLVGFVFALILVNGVHFNSTHAQCGLSFFLFMLLQPLNGLLRPKHEAKWRRPWELFHKSLGYFLLLFAMLTAILGSLESGGGAAVVAPLIIVIVLVVGVLAFREFRACKGKSGPYGAGGGGGGGPALQKGGGGGLPPGWSSAIDPNSGRTYYVNSATGQTTWEPPAAAPPPANPPPPPGPPPSGEKWNEVRDPNTGRVYYHNPQTGATSWTKP